MVILDYIPDDGYTEPGYLRAKPGMHNEVRFEYRPMRTQERSRMIAAMRNKEAGEADAILAKAIASRMKSWTIKTKEGTTAPINAEFVLGLKFSLFDDFAGIVCYGTRASDLEDSADKSDEFAELQTEAAITGKTVEQLRAERDEKN